MCVLCLKNKRKQNVQILFCAISFILGNKNQKLTFTILFFLNICCVGSFVNIYY